MVTEFLKKFAAGFFIVLMLLFLVSQMIGDAERTGNAQNFYGLLGAMGGIIAFLAILMFFGFLIWLTFRDRHRERQAWLQHSGWQYQDRGHERFTSGAITYKTLENAQVSQEAAILLTGYIADGLRVQGRRGREVLVYPDGRQLPVAQTDLTANEITFMKAAQTE